MRDGSSSTASRYRLADPDRLLTNAGARTGDRLILTKPLGTGVLVNAFKVDKIDEAELEPALGMERLNDVASRLALEHGAHGATDVTGFALAGHALGMAKASGAGIRIVFERLPVHDNFYRLAKAGVTTGCTVANADNVGGLFEDRAKLDRLQREVLFDPQDFGGPAPLDSAGERGGSAGSSDRQRAPGGGDRGGAPRAASDRGGVTRIRRIGPIGRAFDPILAGGTPARPDLVPSWRFRSSRSPASFSTSSSRRSTREDEARPRRRR